MSLLYYSCAGLVGSPDEAVAPVWIAPDGPGLWEHIVLVVSEVAGPSASLDVEPGLVVRLLELLRRDVARLVIAGSHLRNNSLV